MIGLLVCWASGAVGALGYCMLVSYRSMTADITIQSI